MLNSVQLIDFCNHKKTRLSFGPMTALVGRNGSGKTSVMRALELVQTSGGVSPKAGTKSQYERVGGKEAIIAANWSLNSTSSGLEAALYFDDRMHWFDRFRYPEELFGTWLPEPPFEEPHFRRHSRIVDMLTKHSTPAPARAPGTVRIRDYGPLSWRCRYFKTNGAVLQGPSYSEETSPTIKGDGSNLAWTLAYLMTAEPDRFATIVNALKEVVPVVRRIRARPAQITRVERKSITINKQERSYDEEQPVMGQELIFDMASGTGLPAKAVSEGTLVTLALLTLVYGGADADMIMLDDVELGLHPKAQRDLMKQLRRLQELHPKLQLLVSTHSPYIVDELTPEEVWLFATDPEGCAVSKRMSDHPDAARSLEVLTTGEFWSAEGEDWVLENGGDEKAVAKKRKTA